MTKWKLPRSSALAGLVIAAMAIFHAVAASEPQYPPSTAAIKYCPVMTDEEIDETIFVDWHGKRVYFCCERCKTKFNRDPEKYASAIELTQDATSANSIDGDQSDDQGEGESASAASSQRAETQKRPVQKAKSDRKPTDKRGKSSKLLNWLGKFHPVTVHMPIGVLIAAVLAEILYSLSMNPIFDHSSRFCIWVAALTGTVSATLGWFLGGLRLTDSDNLLAWHRWLGTTTSVGLLILLLMSERMHRSRANRKSFRLALLFMACLLGATGFFGGAMVWGLDHYSWN